MGRGLRRIFPGLLAIATLSANAAAQNEAALRSAFEGRQITVKIEMPGTAKGIDVFPEDPAPVNWREVADRQKDNGTALRIGQRVMVTKVVVKKDHIEFQLAGGGFGTAGDNTGSEVSSTDESESKFERQLRDSIKTAPNAAKKKEFQKELDNARSERERENARARAAAELANQTREANIRQKRLEGGSRFNIWYKRGMPPDALVPDGVMRDLGQYVEFQGRPVAMNGQGGAPSNTPSNLGAMRPAPGSNALMLIKKGLLISDVEQLLGPANTANESKEGVLTLMKRSYLYDGKKIMASFVNGVLIDYAIAPE
jgi:hypothetical protein